MFSVETVASPAWPAGWLLKYVLLWSYDHHFGFILWIFQNPSRWSSSLSTLGTIVKHPGAIPFSDAASRNEESYGSRLRHLPSCTRETRVYLVDLAGIIMWFKVSKNTLSSPVRSFFEKMLSVFVRRDWNTPFLCLTGSERAGMHALAAEQLKEGEHINLSNLASNAQTSKFMGVDLISYCIWIQTWPLRQLKFLNRFPLMSSHPQNCTSAPSKSRSPFGKTHWRQLRDLLSLQTLEILHNVLLMTKLCMSASLRKILLHVAEFRWFPRGAGVVIVTLHRRHLREIEKCITRIIMVSSTSLTVGETWRNQYTYFIYAPT